MIIFIAILVVLFICDIWVNRALCPQCGKIRGDVKRRELNTAYMEDELNYQTSCKRCYLVTFDHYAELWREYNTSRM